MRFDHGVFGSSFRRVCVCVCVCVRVCVPCVRSVCESGFRRACRPCAWVRGVSIGVCGGLLSGMCVGLVSGVCVCVAEYAWGLCQECVCVCVCSVWCAAVRTVSRAVRHEAVTAARRRGACAEHVLYMRVTRRVSRRSSHL